MSDPVVLLSTGDVVGPAGGVTDNSMVLFSGTSGKLIKGNNAVVTTAGLALLDDVDAAAQRTTLGLKTGAVTDKTTSATDTTAGSMLKVGDFGLGYNVGGGLVDFNTVIWTGFFEAGGTESQGAALNWPSTGLAGTTPVWFNLQTSSTIGNNRISQIATECYSTVSGVRQWIRTKHDANWEPWVEVWTSSNLVKTTSATDKTAGSMLKVGDFGVGTPIPTTNLNTLTGTGLFSCGDVTGTPGTTLLGWWVYQIDAGAGYWKNQTAWKQGTTAAQYVRSSTDGTTWSAWIPVVFNNSPAFTGTPTAPTAGAGTNTTQLANTAFVKAAVDDAPRVGVGQTWQDVTGSRAANTTYTNSTGKPIQLSILSRTSASASPSSMSLEINGVIVISDATTAHVGTYSLSQVVPHMATYRLVHGSNMIYNKWAELR